MYKEDLSLSTDEFGNTLINIGWIEAGKAFTKGDADDFFIGSLWDFCRFRVDSKRGFHSCEHCDQGGSAVPLITYENEVLKAGFSEIRVFDKEDKIYAAPNLIFHYVVEHNYLPPQEFIEAVCYGVGPDSAQYFMLLGSLKPASWQQDGAF